MAESNEMPVEIICKTDSSKLENKNLEIPCKIPSPSPRDAKTKKLNSPNVRTKMLKQQSFDPTMASNNKGVFRGRTTYSQVERPGSTRSLETKRPKTATTKKATPVPDGKPQTPHSFRASSATLNNFIRPPDQHKPGQVPLYLGKTNKYTMESELHSKRNKFNMLKKKLTQDQSDIMDLYRNIIEAQQRVHKMNGKCMPVEKIELIACVADTENPNLWIKGNNLNSDTCELKASQVIQQLLDQFQRLNFDLIGKIKEGTSRHITSFKLNENEDNSNFMELFSQELDTLVSHSINQQREQVATFADKIKPLVLPKEVPLQNTFEPDSNITSPDESELIAEIDKKNTEIDILEKKIKNLKAQAKKTHEQNQFRDQELSDLKQESKKLNTELPELRAKLEESVSQEGQYRKRITAMKKQNQTFLEDFEQMSKQFQLEKEIRLASESECEALRKKIDKLEEYQSKKLTDDTATQPDAENSSSENNKKLMKQIKVQEKQILKQKDEIATLNHKFQQKLNEIDTQKTKELELSNDVRDLEKKIKHQTGMISQIKDLLSTKSLDMEKTQYENELLKKKISILETECTKIGNQYKTAVTTFETNQTNSAADELQKLKERLKKHEDLIVGQNQEISKLENLLKTKTAHLAEVTLEMEQEKTRLQILKSEKKTQVISLKKDLSKAQDLIKQQESVLLNYEKILRVRGELIKTLQQCDQLAHGKMTELYSETDQNIRMTNRMENEVSAKAEELQNLFSTLTTKQMQVKRQDRIIDMLEANNDKCRRIRNQQSDKISALEKENELLRKQLQSLLPGNCGALSNDFDDRNDGDYQDQSLVFEYRQKKRENKIQVKKYSH